MTPTLLPVRPGPHLIDAGVLCVSSCHHVIQDASHVWTKPNIRLLFHAQSETWHVSEWMRRPRIGRSPLSIFHPFREQPQRGDTCFPFPSPHPPARAVFAGQHNGFPNPSTSAEVQSCGQPCCQRMVGIQSPSRATTSLQPDTGHCTSRSGETRAQHSAQENVLERATNDTSLLPKLWFVGKSLTKSGHTADALLTRLATLASSQL